MTARRTQLLQALREFREAHGRPLLPGCVLRVCVRILPDVTHEELADVLDRYVLEGQVDGGGERLEAILEKLRARSRLCN
jgi:hypothetical protein